MANDAYRDFVPQFMRLLFSAGDYVRIAQIPVGRPITNERLERDAAIQRLLHLHNTPNIYFAQSVLDSGPGFTQDNCLYTRAVCLDIDYGQAGHKKPPFFDTLDEAYACIMTAPLAPTCVWHTGHGLQVMYRLVDPYVFHPSIDPVQRIALFAETTRRLADMLQGDAAFTPEHLFRVPLSLNVKTGVPEVRGRVLYWHEQHVYSWADLQQAAGRYDIPPSELKRKPPPANDDTDRIVVSYHQLPTSLQNEIERTDHPDRSVAWYRLIDRMWEAGYAEDVIWSAMSEHFHYPSRYRDRLREQFDICLAKIRGRPRAYADAYMPLEPPNEAESVALDDCAPLAQDVESMLDRYGQAAGIAVTDRLKKSARLHEHLFAQHQAGVMESPCGYGKSTWALCHIALRAGVDSRYLYVAETLSALHKAADVLEQLNPELSVGRYHGFDGDRCYALCGEHHDWRECSPTNDERVCDACQARDRCTFYNRDQELEKHAVIMCHNGLVRLLETRPEALDDRNIIIDEDLNGFLTVEFTLDDLRLVSQYLQRMDVDVGALLPYTRFSAGPQAKLEGGCRTFAGLNYIYRDEQQTAALAPIVDGLRKGLGAGFLDPFKYKAAEIDHAHSVLLELINFFRPSARGDSCYAYREIVDDDSVKYVCKKSRFSLDRGLPGRRLWILNASAELSTTPYPPELTVYKCPDLQPNSPLVILHVIQGNPMRSKQAAQMEMAGRIIRDICGTHGRPEALQHKHVFVAVDRKATEQKKADMERLEATIKATLGEDVTITTLTRGRIRGSNDAGHCTLACLASMSFFTTIDNVALSTAISLRRTLPIAHLFSKSGRLSMPGGRFKVPAMREHFAFSALDELYQTLYRSGVRNDQPVEVIVVMPDSEWISLLWRTVMPGFRFNAVYTCSERGFEVDEAMTGLLGLMMEPPGEEIAKSVVARRLGYSVNTEWKDKKNRARIRLLLDPFYEDVPDNVQRLRRRDVG